MAVSGCWSGPGVPARLAPPVAVAYFTVAFIASSCCCSRCARPLVPRCDPAFEPVLRLEGRLAQCQLRRRPVRTALTAGVLYIAVTVGVGLGTTVINNVNDVRKWSRETFAGDFYVQAMMPDTANGSWPEFRRRSRTEMRRIPGVTNVDTIQVINGVDAAGHASVVVGRQFIDPGNLGLTCSMRTRPRCVKACWRAR